MNARWERPPDAGRAVAELCAATLEKLHVGEYAPVPDLIETLYDATRYDATRAEGGPIVTQLVEATRRLAEAWRELFARASRQKPKLAKTYDHAAPRSRPPANGSKAGTHTLKVIPEHRRLPAANEASCPTGAVPVLAANVLGPFRALLNGQEIQDWPNCRGKAIFKYLLLHRKRPVARETLTERFWPEAGPEAARNSLNVAIHRLRRSLRRDSFPLILFSDGHYHLNPKLVVSVDADAFLAHAARGSEFEHDRDADGATREYSACVALYQGELLAEDRRPHDDWLLPLRQQFRDRYLHVLDRLGRIQLDRRDVLDCTATFAKILAVDVCNEGAHRHLMRCYGALGQPQLAQRQYQTCIQALHRELGIPASRETTELYRQIVRRDAE